MFQDEARFGRINDVRRCWAPRPIRPICRAMLTHEYTYAYGAVDVVGEELLAHACFADEQDRGLGAGDCLDA